MEITINEHEAEFLNFVRARHLSQRYWQAPRQAYRLKHEQLENALKAGITHLEIRVSNILSPGDVKLSCSPFNKRRYPFPIETGEKDRTYDLAFENIEQAVERYGFDTTFVFKYPIKKLLNFELLPVDALNQDWFYDLCKGYDETVFLLLYFDISQPGPGGDTVSCGVKIPRGAQQ
jgi:hypothetical protein